MLRRPTQVRMKCGKKRGNLSKNQLKNVKKCSILLDDKANLTIKYFKYMEF